MTRNLISIAILAAAVALALPSVAGASGDAEAGKAIYMANCLSCHGATGKGDGPVGLAMKGTPNEPRDFSAGEFKFDTTGDGTPGTDEDLAGVIKNGGAAAGGSALMAPWPALSDGDVANVIAYIRSLQH